MSQTLVIKYIDFIAGKFEIEHVLHEGTFRQIGRDGHVSVQDLVLGTGKYLPVVEFGEIVLEIGDDPVDMRVFQCQVVRNTDGRIDAVNK